MKIYDLMTKANKSNLSNTEIIDLRSKTAEVTQMRNTLQGCQIEMAELLEKKRQLNTEEFFQKKWRDEASNMSPFNKPNSRKVTYRNKHLPSMVGGRSSSRYRRHTKKNRS